MDNFVSIRVLLCLPVRSLLWIDCLDFDLLGPNSFPQISLSFRSNPRQNARLSLPFPLCDLVANRPFTSRDWKQRPSPQLLPTSSRLFNPLFSASLQESLKEFFNQVISAEFGARGDTIRSLLTWWIYMAERISKGQQMRETATG